MTASFSSSAADRGLYPWRRYPLAGDDHAAGTAGGVGKRLGPAVLRHHDEAGRPRLEPEREELDVVFTEQAADLALYLREPIQRGHVLLLQDRDGTAGASYHDDKIEDPDRGAFHHLGQRGSKLR